jgi:HK97 family phage major capsid protein
MAKEITDSEVREALTGLVEGVKENKDDMKANAQVVLEKFEDQNEKIATAQAAADTAKKDNEDLKEAMVASGATQEEAEKRVDELEIKLSRANEQTAEKSWKEGEQYQEMNTWARGGIVQETLRTDINVSGGFLVQPEFDNVIQKGVTELNPMRSVSRVRVLSGKSLDIPKRTAIPTATYEGEAEAGGNSESTYALQSLTPFRQTFSSQITQDQLNDAAFDMEAEMQGDASLAFAVGEGNAFVLGAAVKVPRGVFANAEVLANTTASGTAGVQTFAGLMEVTGELPSGYDPRWFFNRRTLAEIRGLINSTTGQPIWEPGINGLVASTLAGAPYTILPAMADTANASVSVGYGDMRQCYTIADRTGMSVVRDDVTLKKQAIIEFTWNRWNTGDVVLSEAMRVITTSS